MNKVQAVAVTGARGFIGQGVIAAMVEAGITVHAISRQGPPVSMPDGVVWHQVAAYDDPAALVPALQGADLVVHLADNPARAEGRSAEMGVQLLEALISAMTEADTGRLVLTSSVYARIAPNPGGYGHAKAAIEAALTGSMVPARVILRLPPVYGPGGGGGFATLAKLAAKGLPLPFGLARAPRDYLSRANLAQLIVALARAGDAAWAEAGEEIFEPSDGQAISTADLTRALARAQGRTARLLPVPTGLLRLMARLAGKAEMVAGALDPLTTQGNAALTRIFGWTPHEQVPQSLAFLAKGGLD